MGEGGWLVLKLVAAVVCGAVLVVAAVLVFESMGDGGSGAARPVQAIMFWVGAVLGWRSVGWMRASREGRAGM